MHTLSLVTASLIAALDAGMGGFESRPIELTESERLTETSASPSAQLIARRQLAVVETADGETKEAHVQAHLSLSKTGGAAQMDGAILIVAAEDYAPAEPIPGQPAGEWTKIALSLHSTRPLESGGFGFDGVATLYYRTGRWASFRISGTIRPAPDSNGNVIVEVAGDADYEAAGGVIGFGMTITSRWD
jgi:hypothetical protein